MEQFDFNGQGRYIEISRNRNEKKYWGIIVTDNSIWEGEIEIGNPSKYNNRCEPGNFGRSVSMDGIYSDHTIANGEKLFCRFSDGNLFLSDRYTYVYIGGTKEFLLGEFLMNDGSYAIGYFDPRDYTVPEYGELYDINDNLIKSYIDMDFAKYVNNIDSVIEDLKTKHRIPIIGQGTLILSDGVFTGDIVYREIGDSGKMVYSDGKIYEGEWKNGRWNGKGNLSWDGNVYEGEFVNGKCDGVGVRKWASGDTYNGCWKKGKRHGMGKQVWHDGHFYDGAWANDKREGLGRDSMSNGTWSKGEWRDGVLVSGSGVANYDDGFYEGGFGKDYCRSGKGEMTWKNGHVYNGYWLGDKRHGEGLDSFPDGTWSRGVWKIDDFVSGNGVQSYLGGRYEGELGKSLTPNGNGVVTNPNGTNYKSVFKENMLVRGEGTKVSNGERIDGTFNKYGPLDSATITFVDGTTMTAKWEQNKDSVDYPIFTVGSVTIKYSNGVHYIGEIEKHLAKGDDVSISDSSEVKYTGGYENGHFNGNGTYIYANGDSLKAIWSETGLVVKTNFVYVWSDGRRCEGVIGKDNEFTKCDYYNADGSDAKRKEYKTWQVNPIPDNIKIVIPSANSIFKY